MCRVPETGYFSGTDELVGIGEGMRVLLTSAGLETEEMAGISCFKDLMILP